MERSTRIACFARIAPALIALLVIGCKRAETKPDAVKRDFKQFQREVYPVLLRDCGFPACHGDKQRLFRVWGPGRSRMPSEASMKLEAFDQPTLTELSASYSLALSMIEPEQPKRSALLRKPLAVAAGGAGHLGVDRYGRDIYRTAEDVGYLALARWVTGDNTGSMPASMAGVGAAGRAGSGGVRPSAPSGRGGAAAGAGAGGTRQQEPPGGDDDASVSGDSGTMQPRRDAGPPDAGNPQPIDAYGACAAATDCTAGAQCVITSNFPMNASVCAPKCVERSDCPVPEGTYEAMLGCVTGFCRLDCTPVLFAPLLSCPKAMTCVAPLIGTAYCHAEAAP